MKKLGELEKLIFPLGARSEFNNEAALRLGIFLTIKEEEEATSRIGGAPLEKQIAKALAKKLGGMREVRTPVGSIDVLTPNEIIEVKIALEWKHGFGQLLAYAKYYPCHIKRLHLFGTDQLKPEIINICKSHQVNVTLEERRVK